MGDNKTGPRPSRRPCGPPQGEVGVLSAFYESSAARDLSCCLKGPSLRSGVTIVAQGSAMAGNKRRQLRLGGFFSVPGNHLGGRREPDGVPPHDKAFSATAQTPH